jgi:soluble lytic murein transglycosylase-like protein
MAPETVVARDVRAESISDTRNLRRNLPLALFLSVLTIVTVFAWQRQNTSAADIGKRTAVVLKASPDGEKAAAAEATAAANAKIFSDELAMGPRALLRRWDPMIAEASKKTGVPEKWIRAIMNTETGGRTMLANGPITSAMGAMGLMQVMPGTYEEMRAQYKLGADPYNARDNIIAGAAYLRWLKSKFGFPKMFAAYNAGPGTFQNHLAGAALPNETVNYAIRVARFLGIPSPKDNAVTALASNTRGNVTFTRPDGTALLVDASLVRFIRTPLPGEFTDGVNAVLSIGRKKQGVREDVVSASLILRKRGSVAG